MGLGLVWYRLRNTNVSLKMPALQGPGMIVEDTLKLVRTNMDGVYRKQRGLKRKKRTPYKGSWMNIMIEL